jgi:2,4-diketo-3-deoxy-L-fuconate hydrolase
MKLLRYGPVGQENPGLLDADGNIRDLSGHISDLGPDSLDEKNLPRIATIDVNALPKVGGSPRLGVPVAGSRKFIAIGSNYRDHGAVIGRRATHVVEAQSLQFVAGFVVVDDLSERNFQNERNGTWDKGKGCDTFGPVGPWLVTKDEIADVQNLDMWLNVNGKRMQTGTTRTMVFGVAHPTKSSETRMPYRKT